MAEDETKKEPVSKSKGDTVIKTPTTEEHANENYFDWKVLESKFIKSKIGNYATFECVLQFTNPTKEVNINSCKASIEVTLLFQEDLRDKFGKQIPLPPSHIDFGMTTLYNEKTSVNNLWTPKTTRSFRFVSKPISTSLFNRTPEEFYYRVTFDFKGIKGEYRSGIQGVTLSLQKWMDFQNELGLK